MIDYLINLVGRLGEWGYLIVFIGAALESAAFMGLLVPGEMLVVAAGFFAAQGLLDLKDLIVLVACGAIIGDSIGYELGRHASRDWLLRHGRWTGLRAAHFERVDAFFAHHGGKAVLIGRFVGLLRALAPFVAGASRMRYPLFLAYNALGGLAWAICFVLLGYLAGASWQVAAQWIGAASAIIGGALLLVGGLTWLWNWLARHETEFKQGWAAVVVHPRIVALRRRFAPQLAFVRNRFSPGGYFGLHLTLGACALIGASWMFGAIAEDVIKGEAITATDATVATWLHDRAVPGLTSAMTTITDLHGPAGLAIMTALAAVVLLWRKQWYWLVMLGLTVPGGAALNVLLKYAFRRQRPVFDDPLAVLATYSFPSGHVMGATVLYGTLAALAVLSIQGWRWQVLSVLLAGLLILVVGFSRLYLGVHYLSDTLAALAEGIAWLALCLTAVETLRRRNERLRS